MYIAIHATPTARNFFLTYFYPSGPFICIFFQNLSQFFPVLAVATRIIAPRVFMSSVFCAWVFLNVLCSQAILIHLSYFVILIVLVCTLFQCKFGYFSYSEYFVSDDLLSRISSLSLIHI